MSTVTQSPEATWLRVADVARLLGVSANTVRRWTDAGRIAALRSPGGHRRYLAADVMALLPNGSEEATGAQPGDFADLKRRAQELTGTLQATLALTALLAEAPHEVPEDAALSLCELTGAPRCIIYVSEGDRFRLHVSTEDGRVRATRADTTWSASDWLPFEQPPSSGLACLNGENGSLSRRESAALRRRGCKALVWAPLTSRGELIGALELMDARPRDLSVYDEIVSVHASICAQALSIASSLRELEHRDKAMRELEELAREVSQTHDLDRFIHRLAQRLQTTLAADAVEVFRARGGVIRVLHSVNRAGIDESTHGRPLDTSRYPALATTLIDQTPLVIEDLTDSRLSAEEVAQYQEWGYASSLTMPLVAGGDLVGLLDFYGASARDWSREVQMLTGVCQMVAGLFDSESLLAEAGERSRLREELVELGTDLSGAASSEDVATRAATRLRRVVDCADCDIWWLEEGYLRCLASVDHNGVDESLCGKLLELDHYPSTRKALEDRQILIVSTMRDPRVTDYEREDFAEFGFASFISVPLVSNRQVVGLIDLYDVRERHYGEASAFLESAGVTVADALRNAELLAELRRGNAALRELVELGDRLSEAGSVDELSRLVSERLRTILEAEDCDVWRIDGDALHCLASIDSGGWDDEEMGTERHLAAYEATVEALATNEPVVIGDLESAGLPSAELDSYRNWGYRSMVSLPLVVDGRPIGLIDIFDTKVRDFANRLDLIRNVSRMLAGAFERAMLVERLEEQLRRTALMTDSALELGSSLDLHETLLVTANRLCASAGVDVCEISVIEDSDLQPLLRVTGGKADAQGAGPRLPLVEADVAREVIETKRPVMVGSLRDPRLSPVVLEIEKDAGSLSWLAVPLIAKDRVIGIAELIDSRAERTFSAGEIDTATAVCHAAALALENAALFEREQTSSRETELLNEIARRTAASLDLEEVVGAAVDALGQLVDFDDHSLLLMDGNSIGQVISSRPQSQILTGLTIDDIGHEFCARIESEHVTLLRLPDDLPEPAHAAVTGLRSAAVIALSSDAGLLGALNLVTATKNAFKPIDRHLLERVGVQLSLAIKNAQLYEEIKQMHLGNLKALSSALNAKDYYTQGHAARVAAYTAMLGRELGWPADLLESLTEAAYLHDIGKISISDRVLLKPGRLNEQEWEQMREHPVISADIIRPLFPEALVLGVRHHHEHFDGSGYPDELVTEEIPVLARAMAVVDAYDAMSCRRPYKAALTYAESLAELSRCRGTQFDPNMVDAFLRVLADLSRRRTQAAQIAAQAATRITGEAHERLSGREDEDSPAYAEITEVLRKVRDANPPTRFLTTHMQADKRYVIGVDPEENEVQKSHIGDEIFADDELPLILAGGQPQGNAVFADEFGVWITGLAPIRRTDGTIVAAVEADLPALSAAESESLRGDGRQTFATMLQSAAVRFSRAEIDAITDALTGLYNHRYLQERLTEELHRARENDRPLSVLFCDLDHFKGYNDANGHSAGDQVLREVAHLIDQAVRNIDISGRYGGEEFVVLLVETDHDAALAVAERIRERIHAAGFSAEGAPLTVSIGIASYPDDADRREDLLDKADWAMYLAKRRGRDQVAAFRDG